MPNIVQNQSSFQVQWSRYNGDILKMYMFIIFPLWLVWLIICIKKGEKLVFFTLTATFFFSLFIHANWSNFIADLKAEEKTLSAPWKFQSLLIIDLDSYLKALLGPTYKIEVKKGLWRKPLNCFFSVFIVHFRQTWKLIGSSDLEHWRLLHDSLSWHF